MRTRGPPWGWKGGEGDCRRRWGCRGGGEGGCRRRRRGCDDRDRGCDDRGRDRYRGWYRYRGWGWGCSGKDRCRRRCCRRRHRSSRPRRRARRTPTGRATEWATRRPASSAGEGGNRRRRRRRRRKELPAPARPRPRGTGHRGGRSRRWGGGGRWLPCRWCRRWMGLVVDGLGFLCIKNILLCHMHIMYLVRARMSCCNTTTS